MMWFAAARCVQIIYFCEHAGSRAFIVCAKCVQIVPFREHAILLPCAPAYPSVPPPQDAPRPPHDAPRPPQDRLKPAPRPPQNGPRPPQDHHMTPETAPRPVQDRLKTPQDRLMTPQDRPKTDAPSFYTWPTDPITLKNLSGESVTAKKEKRHIVTVYTIYNKLTR